MRTLQHLHSRTEKERSQKHGSANLQIPNLLHLKLFMLKRDICLTESLYLFINWEDRAYINTLHNYLNILFQMSICSYSQ